MDVIVVVSPDDRPIRSMPSKTYAVADDERPIQPMGAKTQQDEINIATTMSDNKKSEKKFAGKIEEFKRQLTSQRNEIQGVEAPQPGLQRKKPLKIIKNFIPLAKEGRID